MGQFETPHEFYEWMENLEVNSQRDLPYSNSELNRMPQGLAWQILLRQQGRKDAGLGEYCECGIAVADSDSDSEKTINGFEDVEETPNKKASTDKSVTKRPADDSLPQSTPVKMQKTEKSSSSSCDTKTKHVATSSSCSTKSVKLTK